MAVSNCLVWFVCHWHYVDLVWSGVCELCVVVGVCW